jgi:carbon monoxide dehydrogenase subunit G
MRFTYSNDFACSQERLWRFLEEPELQKQWMKGVLENQPTSEGPRGVGSTFRMKIQEGRKVADYDGKVTAYDKPRQLAVDLSGGNFPAGMVVRVDYQLTPNQGGTHLDYVAEMVMGCKPPWWMRLMMPLGKIFMRLQLRGFMKTLKRLAESPEVA